MLASRDLYPINIKTEQITSAKITRINDISGPRPIGSAKDQFPFNKLINFGIPCVNMSNATAALNDRIKTFRTGP